MAKKSNESKIMTCPKCGSGYGYVRGPENDQEYKCRQCGAVTKINVNKIGGIKND